MKAKLEYLQKHNAGRAAWCYRVEVPRFEFYWHYHPEWELTCILHGSGVRMVGDSNMPFREGDLVLLGTGVPHTWTGGSEGPHEALVLQFRPGLAAGLMQIEELGGLAALFRDAALGVYFPDFPVSTVLPLLHTIRLQEGPRTITAFIELFHRLSQAPWVTLSASVPGPGTAEGYTDRMAPLLQWLHQHYASDISSADGARQLYLSTPAFCRFFKKNIGKTFVDYLNEVRIAHVCHRLLQSSEAVGAIALSCGFTNQAYFNRVFLKLKGVTPKTYRKGHGAAFSISTEP